MITEINDYVSTDGNVVTLVSKNQQSKDSYGLCRPKQNEWFNNAHFSVFSTYEYEILDNYLFRVCDDDYIGLSKYVVMEKETFNQHFTIV